MSWERTGEYREPRVGEWVESPGGPQWFGETTGGRYWILRKAPAPGPRVEAGPWWKTEGTWPHNSIWLVIVEHDVAAHLARYDRAQGAWWVFDLDRFMSPAWVSRLEIINPP